MEAADAILDNVDQCAGGLLRRDELAVFIPWRENAADVFCFFSGTLSRFGLHRSVHNAGAVGHGGYFLCFSGELAHHVFFCRLCGAVCSNAGLGYFRRARAEENRERTVYFAKLRCCVPDEKPRRGDAGIEYSLIPHFVYFPQCRTRSKNASGMDEPCEIAYGKGRLD